MHIAHSKRIFATYEGATRGVRLSDLCWHLHYSQLASWREYAEIVTQVQCTWYREVKIGDEVLKIQWNPARMANVLAKTEPNTNEEDFCPLCLSRLPYEQQAVVYFDEYLVLCNPRPIFTPHFTATTAKHVPQDFISGLTWMLKLAYDFSPGFSIFYNGPHCGASIPEHHHFQIYPTGMLPADSVLAKGKGDRYIEINGVIFSVPSFNERGGVLIAGDDSSRLFTAIQRFVKVLARCSKVEGEPLLNVIASYFDSLWRIVIFPRIKGRPDAFYREGNEKIAISPGAVEMGGMFITINEQDFVRLDAESIISLYREISFPVYEIEGLVKGCVEWLYE
ncbi:MAG: DUF4922 domain-containing protein [Syntrophales bacterium]|nr:DUF4922 domain-containing protein [Syntrophales bacterium]